MGNEFEMLERELERTFNSISAEIIKEVGNAIGTIRPVHFSESGVGGYGILFGNVFGMILAYLLLIIVAISAIVGFIVILKWIFGGKGRKMDPHEKWLKTGKMD